MAGKDFVQIKNGPFDVDLIFAPDGIPSFAAAKARALNVEGFQIANLRDIIASKRATGRKKDLLDLEYLVPRALSRRIRASSRPSALLSAGYR